ncbi:MAG: biopolymer transporter ExbD [Candidatus Coatesbacteria bacterium]|nr:MAG: biopolymer transporter ExbD [Candidatus Coatesbacteria bacterium]
MAFAPKKRIKHREVWEDPELVPFIDMLVVCCCFLLMSASLLQTAVIEISLPTAAGAGTTGATPPQGGELNLSLIITDEGLRVGGAGAILPLIPRKKDSFDWEKLTETLKDVKKQYPDQESVIIIAEPEIVYNDIIQAMDVCVMEGFPDISLSGNITQ